MRDIFTNMSIVLNGNKYEVPGLTTVSFLDEVERKFGNKIRIQPAFGPAIHGKPRDTWIRGIVLHTNRGQLPGEVIAGGKDMKRDIALARYQASSTRVAGWDYTTDTDGSVAVSNDPWDLFTYHAGTVNSYTVGIEIVQDTNSPYNLYTDGLEATVLLVDYLTNRLGIQRQIVCYDESDGSWREKVIPGRLQSPKDRKRGKKEPTGGDVVGIYGHRNVTTNKGPGDPGNDIFDLLKAAGYECFDAATQQDLKVWKKRQEEIGLFEEYRDGVPGPKTRRILANKGYKYGMWVSRPIDALLLQQDIAAGYPDAHKNLFKVPGEQL